MTMHAEYTDVERLLVTILRDKAEAAIRERGVDWAANSLRISVPGVKALLWESRWPVERAVHVASCLDVLTEADVERLATANTTPP